MDTTDASRELHLTVANEDYLECIVRIEEESGSSEGIRSVDIISALKERGLAEQSHYGKVLLTEKGRELGRAVWYRHRLLNAFLTQELGVDAERADAEACMMEHAVSEDTMTRWLHYLEKQGISIGEE